MGILSSNQYISTDSINCGGEFTVTLALSAVSLNLTNPLETAIVIDGSPAGETLENSKTAALGLVRTLAEKTGGTETFGEPLRAAVFGFGSDIPVKTEITNNVQTLEEAIESVPDDNFSNISLAITYAATALLNSDRAINSQKIIFVFTNGDANFGDNPLLAAQTARASGIALYFIAPNGTTEQDFENMKTWANQPGSAFVLKNYGSDGAYVNFLDNLLNNDLGNTPTQVVVTNTVNDDFEISCASSASIGVASLINDRTLRWSIDALADRGFIGGAELTFLVKHTGDTSGTLLLNDILTYTDEDGGTASFPDTEIVVNCGDIIITDDCPEPIETASQSCNEIITIEAGEITTDLTGRIAEISATIKNVCPGRRVAFAAVLTEVDDDGIEYPRGMRTITIPAHSFPECRDIRITGVKLVIPGDIDEIAILPCAERNFRTRIYLNYIDSGYICETT